MWLSWPQACMTPTSWPFQVVFAVDLNGRSHLLGDRQRIHVGAQGHDRARLAALEHRDDAGVRHTGLAPRSRAASVPRR